MKKCMLCEKTIDSENEPKEAEKWPPVVVTIHINGGSESILTGYVCPDDIENITLASLKV